MKPYMDKLISLTQSVFVKVRRIIYNIILANEVIHTLKKNKGATG